jgi:hypothetical protein
LTVKTNKTEIVSFKADPALLKALRFVPNRSEFIRGAVMTALDSSCPLCGGTGNLTPHQKEHWNEFKINHSLQKCADCSEIVLVCSKTEGRKGGK